MKGFSAAPSTGLLTMRGGMLMPQHLVCAGTLELPRPTSCTSFLLIWLLMTQISTHLATESPLKQEDAMGAGDDP